jgi:hypothetical protein
MKRLVVTVLGAGFALFGAVLFSGGFFPSGVAEAAFPGADSLTLVSEQMLPDGTAQATFNWVSYNQGTEFLDITATDPSFGFGSFMSSGPMASWQNSFVWNGLQPGVTYFARVNTLTAYGWVAGAPVSFVLQGNGYMPPLGYVPGYNYDPNYYYQQPYVDPYAYSDVPPPVVPQQTPDGFPSTSGGWVAGQ